MEYGFLSRSSVASMVVGSWVMCSTSIIFGSEGREPIIWFNVRDPSYFFFLGGGGMGFLIW